MKDQIFNKIHKVQINKKGDLTRLTEKINEKYFNLPKGFFKDKVCLDAACGGNGFVPGKLIRLGAKFVDCFDYNHFHKASIKKALDGYDDKYTFHIQNLTKYDHAYFSKYDFVHCSGAIHHDKKYKKILKNLSKYVKPGGYLFISSYGKGGLIRNVVRFLRKEIKRSPPLRKFLHEVSFSEIKNFILSSAFAFNKDYKKYEKEFELFFNEDLLLTIKDRLLAEHYIEIDYAEIKNILKTCNFKNFKDLNFYPQFNNMRKFLSPFYFYKNHKFSKLLYGKGLPQIIAKKY